MIALIFLRIPLAASMFIVGLLGTWLLAGGMRMMNNQLKTFADALNYSFSIIPLFLLMSEFATRAGMSRALFKAAEAWLGHRRGGVAMAAIGASAGFGAVCGSSLATASSMGKAALPELQRAGYSGALATGTLAAGGTLGILLPPSVVLVIFAILAEETSQAVYRCLHPRRAGCSVAVTVASMSGSTPARTHPAAPALCRALPCAGPGVAGGADFCAGDRRHLHRAVSPTAAAAVRAGGRGLAFHGGVSLQSLRDPCWRRPRPQA